MLIKEIILIFAIFKFGNGAQMIAKYCLENMDYKYENLMPGDGGFRLILRDMDGKMVDRFYPEQKYSVTLRNTMYGIRFWDFSVTASLVMDISKMFMMPEIDESHLGRFVIFTKEGKMDYSCPNKVLGNSRRLKYEITFYWIAPSRPIKCVKFMSRIVKSHSMIFANSDMLIKKICPTIMHDIVRMKEGMKISDTRKKLPPMVKECCACGEASYKVTFTGLWSKETHPKEWPKHKSMLHWTNPIGATHNGNYFIYHLGGGASSGVSSICSYGDNTMLKKIFNRPQVKKNLKSYYGTQGMWNEDELLQNRSAFISVNRTFHLFSFLTMMGPSPDWCTGVAAVDLCMTDCAWKKNFSLDLLPFDTGIKHGYTYLPKNSDSLDIPDPIKLINTTIKPEYPFSPGKPVARVTFERVQPMYDWQCSKVAIPGVKEFHKMSSDSRNGNVQDNNGDDSMIYKKKRGRGSKKNSVLDDPSLRQMATFLCITSEWSLWTPCSVTCGIGTRMRSRQMLRNLKNELCRHLPLVEKRDCEGRKRSCDFSKPCSVLPWSSWSPCNATCKKSGYSSRHRMFARTHEKQGCLNQTPMLKLSEFKMCDKPKNLCDPIVICSEGLAEGLECGKPKTRYWYDASSQKCTAFKYKGCKGSLNRFSSRKKCEMTCYPAVAALPMWKKEKLALLQFQSVADQQSQNKKPKMMAKQCYKKMNHGNVKMCQKSMSSVTTIRYYFSMRTGRCRPFKYSACVELNMNMSDKINLNEMKKDGMNMNEMKKDRMNKNEMDMNEIKKDGMNKDDMNMNEMKKDGMNKNEMDMNEMKKDGMNKDDMNINEMKKDGMNMNEIKKNEINKDHMNMNEMKRDDLTIDKMLEDITMDDMKDGIQMDEIKKNEKKMNETNMNEMKKDEMSMNEMKKVGMNMNETNMNEMNTNNMLVDNNFISYSSCIETCIPMKATIMKQAPKRDCKLSNWSHWGPCSTMKCGLKGERQRWRVMLRPQINGGKACDNLVELGSCMTQCP